MKSSTMGPDQSKALRIRSTGFGKWISSEIPRGEVEKIEYHFE
jgi:hypothetical protein